ncbi:hypothetical protein [Aestuariibaculum lutulentum]|uniref:Uncharacterized protein n=1 Tax=Aestuariibaculum lutulentum TaxID=2920935 RepID=A0ABS9RFP4_9FLAO|nr:hypothetical protein [Aestuariibaculum lutulentum]MCH4551769.1 hypothetical protein [Aestuariibaculum lutulentum]
MKALRITFIAAAIFATLTSCTKQDLNEDDVLIDAANDITIEKPITGGGIDD